MYNRIYSLVSVFPLEILLPSPSVMLLLNVSQLINHFLLPGSQNTITSHIRF